MNREQQVLSLCEELHENLDAESQDLTPLQVGVVVRAAAERAVEEVEEERVRLLAYFKYHFPDDARIQIAIEQCEIGAHRRNRSQAIEAVTR